MSKAMITCAICGAEVTKEQNPAVPYTVEEIVREARLAFDAGAAIIHLHVRYDNGESTQDRERYRVCMEAIEAACPGVIIIPSTGGAVGMSAEERLQPVALNPQIATLDCGTSNFGDEVFENTLPMLRTFGEEMCKRHIKPECECFEKGHVETALHLAKKGFIPVERMHFNFVLGVQGAMPATANDLAFLAASIPHDATWCATGIGRHQFPLAAVALAMGGNVRVGFEDNLYYEKGRLAKSNGELVEKAVQLARLIGREIASPAEARSMLGLPPA